MTAAPETAPAEAPAAAALAAVPAAVPAVAAGAATGGKGSKGAAKRAAPAAPRRRAQTAADAKQEGANLALQHKESSGVGQTSEKEEEGLSELTKRRRVEAEASRVARGATRSATRGATQ